MRSGDMEIMITGFTLDHIHMTLANHSSFHWVYDHQSSIRIDSLSPVVINGYCRNIDKTSHYGTVYTNILGIMGSIQDMFQDPTLILTVLCPPEARQLLIYLT